MVRFESDGGVPEDAEGIAPVIPLFGGRRSAPAPEPTRGAGAGTATVEPVRGDVAQWRSTWDAGLDPVLAEETDEERADRVAAAERVLLKKLRARQLSVAEARAAAVERELLPDEVETLLASFERLGYLDDARLAEQLIHAGTQRKGQGQRAIAQTLSSRGIPRDVAEEALAEQPDDEAERALEFARTKARQLESVDQETAMRRLMGQLSRRGYAGSVAASAARTALAESRTGGGVRFR
ncbi:RecX family transcriptional regulator [Microbacterium sp. zg.Y625]|uniref:regulatory protein RecX n=1 Tax=Microbacterium jiangjiandongii TaxID=3049071 RepID=UPI00214A8F59|nr:MULTISPECIES: regulatory protein RecX [unclassified Microbacterium]MCR2794401.1 RecX family transcriptional regulator [Microbacterium sp. zg.Y625]MCR2815939.1 RecX family transcriptional regulator [Microbacterium sp. zg.Y843]WIM26312.1 regulatory protein RecX [Microbacterium sp. zg-Y625]